MKPKPEKVSWSDLAKKVVYTGLGSAALAKNLVTNSETQKDIVNGLLSKVEQRKDELLEILAREVSKFLGRINVSEEVSRALEGLEVNLSAKVDFSKKGKPRATLKKAEVRKKS